MKDILVRNKPIFLIGFITIAIFVLIIVLAQKNSPAGPKMIPIEEVELISKTTPVMGNRDSAVKLVEFSDFECPACGAYYPVIKKIEEQYGDKLLIAYRHFPLAQHENAKNAAYASVAAYNQGKFWEYADKLFNNQDRLSEKDLVEYARELGLDVKNFSADYDSEKTKKIVEDDIQLGYKLKLNSTPSFVLGDKLLNLSSPQKLEQEITKALTEQGYNLKVGSLNKDPYADIESAKETGETEKDETTTVTGNTTPNSKPSVPDNTNTPSDSEDTPDITPTIPGLTIIKYTDENGFKPKQVSVAVDSTILWLNETDHEIKIEELTTRFEEFKKPVSIAPGGTLEFTIYEKKLWTYQESTTKQFGSIFVN